MSDLVYTTVMPSNGSQLFVKATGDDAYVQVANITTMDGPSMTVAQKDISTLQSQANAGGKEYVFTTSDGGEVSGSLEYNLNDDSHAKLLTLIQNPQTASFKIVFPSGGDLTQAVANGGLTELSAGGIEPDGVVTASFKIKASGAWTIS